MIRRNQRQVVLVSAAVWAVMGLTSCSSPEVLPSVQELIDRHIVARGGRDNLSAIKTRRLTIRESYANGETRVTVITTRAPNKELVVIREEGGPEVIRMAFNGSNGYALVRGERQDLSAKELAQLEVDSDIFPELRFDLLFPTARVVGRETWHDRSVYRVDATSTAGEEERFFFDSESGLMIGTEYPGVPASHFLEAFEDYLGVKYPRTRQKNVNGKSSREQLMTIEHNVNIDDAIFNLR